MRNRVRELRRAKGLTQDDLAGMAGIGRSTVSNIETSKYVPGVDVAILIARALGGRVEDIFIVEREDR